MSISNLTLFSALKSRMSWLQARQDVLAENVANADTPGFAARDLKAQDLSGLGRSALRPAVTRPGHMLLADADGAATIRRARGEGFEQTASGNTVTLEEEMMKVAQTQMEYQLATGLYGRGVGLLKTALGRA